ncbi:MAG: hypothetical protein A2Y02_01055 [Omnitrophica bacterium GWA2_52_12]|nr:MAG: hypothetical protein A2Y02_01055 [Omnitrophica bacterium GWA2_52_12]
MRKSFLKNGEGARHPHRDRFVRVPGTFLLLMVLWLAPCVHAAEVTKADAFSKELSLAGLLKAAAQANPDIRAARLKWEAARKKSQQALSLPDPMVGMDVMGEMSESRVGPEENRLMISQKIPFPAKIWKRWQVQREMAKAARREYEAVRRDVLLDARKTHYQLYQTDGALAVIHEIHELLTQMGAAARARYAEGSAGQRDAAKAQAEVSLTLGRVFQLEQKRGALHARLNALLDRDPLLAFGPAGKPAKPVLKETLAELLTLAARQRQEILKSENKIRQKKHEKTLAWMKNIPDLDAGFSYTWVGGGMTSDMEDGKDSWMFPLSVNVPLWQNRNIAAIQEASKELEAARAQLSGMRNETFYEVRDAYLRCETALKIAVLYESGVLPQAELALNSDRAGYEAGRTDFLGLLDSERVYLDAKLGYLKIFTEALKSRADLDRAIGKNGLEHEHEKSV